MGASTLYGPACTARHRVHHVTDSVRAMADAISGGDVPITPHVSIEERGAGTTLWVDGQLQSDEGMEIVTVVTNADARGSRWCAFWMPPPKVGAGASCTSARTRPRRRSTCARPRSSTLCVSGKGKFGEMLGERRCDRVLGDGRPAAERLPHHGGGDQAKFGPAGCQAGHILDRLAHPFAAA